MINQIVSQLLCGDRETDIVVAHQKEHSSESSLEFLFIKYIFYFVFIMLNKEYMSHIYCENVCLIFQSEFLSI